MPDSITLPDVINIAPAPQPATRQRISDDKLTLIVRGKEWSGWQRVTVQHAMDQVPASFSLQVTEKFPRGGTMAFKAGDPCVVKIGGDTVITGFIDRYSAVLGPTDHGVRIDGRSKSADLVDCSAFTGSRDNPDMQVKGGTTVSIAQELAKQYDIDIKTTAGNGPTIQQFDINPGETVWEIVDRMSRYSKLIIYDLPDGTMEFAQVGKQSMASGFQQGVNIERASVAYTMDQRFSDYVAYLVSSQAFSDSSSFEKAKGGEAKDSGVPRFRKRIIISEQSFLGVPIAKDRAEWEMNRRKGRSMAVNVTCDSWRDSGGTLWAINHLAPIHLPALHCEQDSWVIGSVTFTRDEAGQHAHVTLMAPGAFAPEPMGDFQGPPMVDQIMGNNPTAPDNQPYTPGGLPEVASV
jgi:prophage tail gpP-like protein